MINVKFLNTKDNTSWVQTNVYTPNTKWGRKYIWMDIANQRRDFSNENWVIMGDFNTPLKKMRKWGEFSPIWTIEWI